MLELALDPTQLPAQLSDLARRRDVEVPGEAMNPGLDARFEIASSFQGFEDRGEQALVLEYA